MSMHPFFLLTCLSVEDATTSVDDPVKWMEVDPSELDQFLQAEYSPASTQVQEAVDSVKQFLNTSSSAVEGAEIPRRYKHNSE